jgi:hypothetical protein
MACVLLGTSGCPPEVKSFTPVKGPAGTPVEITGKNFADNAAGNVVKFNGKAATTVTKTADGKLVATVPTDATTGTITVTTGSGTGTSVNAFTVEGPLPPGKKWTFMVYLDADNNLEQEGLGDFAEMAQVGSGDQVNIVVEMDRTPGYSDEQGDWTETRRFQVMKNDTPGGAALQNLGEKNMGDPAVLTDFVKWAATNYPADYYALVIWNHGSGWRFMLDTMKARAARNTAARAPGMPAPASVIKAVAFDDTDGDELYMKEVQTALETADQNLTQSMGKPFKLSIVGFDACLMGMVEVAYALRNVTDYVVGSEETEPGEGWPYDAILGVVATQMSTDPKTLATLIVDKYGASYGPGSGVTQSAVDVSKLAAVVAGIDAFAGGATSEWDQLKTARTNAQQYHVAGYESFWGTDLWDYANRVYSGVSSNDIKTAASNLKAAIDAFVVAEFHGSQRPGSHGTAIYFPKTKSAHDNDPEHTAYTDANAYQPVDFVKEHQWDNWLQQFYQH